MIIFSYFPIIELLIFFIAICVYTYNETVISGFMLFGGIIALWYFDKLPFKLTDYETVAYYALGFIVGGLIIMLVKWLEYIHKIAEAIKIERDAFDDAARKHLVVSYSDLPNNEYAMLGYSY